RPAVPAAAAPIAQAFPIVRRALKILADREVSPQTGLLKSTLLQLDSTFSERNYGASSFLDFVEKLAQAGLVQLKHAGRSVMVELNDGFDEDDVKVRTTTVTGTTTATGTNETADSEPSAAHAFGPASPGVAQPTESAAEGVRLAGEILRNADGARWPMYLRNVTQ